MHKKKLLLLLIDLKKLNMHFAKTDNLLLCICGWIINVYKSVISLNPN